MANQQQTDGSVVMVQARIVWTSGDLFEGQKQTIFGTNQPKLNDKGEQSIQYGFGLAVPKEALNHMGPGQPGEIWAVIHREAQKLFPSGVPGNFAWKWKDGDTAKDKNGTLYSELPGRKGCIIFACTSTIKPKFFIWENGGNTQVNQGIKCGDYVNVQLGVKAQSSGIPGLYLNPMAVQLIGYGEAIISAASGNDIFGTSQPPVPQGATAMPSAPQAGPIVAPPAAPSAPPPPSFPSTTAGYAAPVQPVAPASFAPAVMQAPQAPPPQAAPPAPHYGVVPQQFQPPAQPQGFPPPPPGM